MPPVVLLLSALVFTAQAAPLSPVVAALIEALEPEAAATLKPSPDLQSVAQAVTPASRPGALAALAHLEKSGDASLLPEIARAYSLLGDGRAALAASSALQRARPGPESEVQHALTLARAGETRAAYAAAVELDKKYPGRPDVASLLAATKGRGGASSTEEGPRAETAAVRSISALALPAMERALAARRDGDLDAAWLHVQDAMRADPGSPIVQDLYRAAEADRRRHAGPRFPAAGLSGDIPREETPRPSGGLPLWPVAPAAGLGAAAFVVARRGRAFAADHDYEAEDYRAGETERFIAGALLAGMAGGAIYLGSAWLVGAAPAMMRVASNSGQQALRVAKSEVGAVNPGRASAIQPGPTLNNLNLQLAARQIANGHAFSKHAAEVGARTPTEFEKIIEQAMLSPTMVRNLSGGRVAYWHQSSATVVIRNPKALDGGTAFAPQNGIEYFHSLR